MYTSKRSAAIVLWRNQFIVDLRQLGICLPSHMFPGFPAPSTNQSSRQIALKAMSTIIMSVISLKFSNPGASISIIGLVMQSFFALRCLKSARNVNTAFKDATDVPTSKDKFLYVLLYTIAFFLYVAKLGRFVLPIEPQDWLSVPNNKPMILS
ncbi:hypothetical protein RCL1_004942 [Eukaryota sp. TZLM3-RCL]